MERRARALPGNAALPGEFGAAVAEEVLGERGTAPDAELVSPCFSVGAVSPVVVRGRGGVLVAAVPLVEAGGDAGAAFSVGSHPAVAVASMLADAMLECATAALDAGRGKGLGAELRAFLLTAAPFGTAQWASAELTSAVSGERGGGRGGGVRMPGWRTEVTKGAFSRSQLGLRIVERVRAVQYDSEATPDVLQVSGHIECCSSIEGAPELSVEVRSRLGLEDVASHFCVHGLEPPPGGSGDGTVNKLRFVPPTHPFTLAAYRVSPAVATLPIRGYFQLKLSGDCTIELLVQLKVDPAFAGGFKRCSVTVPMHGRGRIAACESSPTSGAASVSADRRSLNWDLGGKWRSPEVALPTTIQLEPGSGPEPGDDPFCVGHNAYVEISFAVADASFSGARVEADGVQSSGQSRPALSVERSVETDGYLIWNSLGRARATLHPEKLFDVHTE